MGTVLNEIKKLKDTHPFESFFSEDIQMLILGSIPPSRFTRAGLALKNGDFSFYYGSSDNYLWGILSKVNNLPLINPEQIKDFLSSNKIGITDIVEQCNRKLTDKGHPSASDEHLIDIQFRKMDDVLATNSLMLILCTSDWVRKKFEANYNFNKEKVSIVAIPSPSRSGSRQMGKSFPEYNQMKSDSFKTYQFREYYYSKYFKFT